LAAQGIAAEIPQACHRQDEELERKARFFAAFYAAKNAPKFLKKNHSSNRALRMA
jgi:hypothetical protein